MSYVMKGQMGTEEWLQLIKEIEHDSDRAAAVVGGTFLEVALQRTLVSHFHPDKKITGELFHPSGALGAFATKIRVAKLVGIFANTAYKDFTIIKNIRNTFAHEMEIHSFTQKPICDWAANLKLVDSYSAEPPKNISGPDVITAMKETGAWIFREGRDQQIKTPRGRFVLSIQVLSWGLSTASETAMPTPKF